MTVMQCRAHSEAILAQKGLRPDLVRKVRAILQDVNAHSTGGWVLGAFEGKRSLARQLKLIAQGNSKTRHSRHIVGRAIDCVFFMDGHWTWDSRLPWHLIGSSARAHGLTWGGSWKTLRDYPHVQI